MLIAPSWGSRCCHRTWLAVAILPSIVVARIATLALVALESVSLDLVVIVAVVIMLLLLRFVVFKRLRRCRRRVPTSHRVSGLSAQEAPMIRAPTSVPPGAPKTAEPDNYSDHNREVCENWTPLGAKWSPFKALRLKLESAAHGSKAGVREFRGWTARADQQSGLQDILWCCSVVSGSSCD